MFRSDRFVPLVIAVALLGLAGLPAARAQAPSARFAFADTTLLRDTLDLHFDRLFPLADSLRVTPDSLRALSIRFKLPLERMVFLSDSLGAPVDSVGSIFEREQFNPLARTVERSTSFHYESSYAPSRLSSTWGNSAIADLVRGPITLHNVTSVTVNRIRTGSTYNFRRAKSAVTETGWRFTPDLSAGARFNVQRTESDQLGSQRVTSNTDVQGSIRSRFRVGKDLTGELNGFGGPFDEPSNSLSSGAKSGIGTQFDGHLQFAGPSWITFDNRGTTNLRIGHATIPDRARFRTRDLKWNARGNANLFPSSPATLSVTYTLSGDRTERASSVTEIVPTGGSFDTVVTARLLSDPGRTAGLEVATQFATNTSRLSITGTLDRSTRLLASERKEGIVIDRTEGRNSGFTIDGSIARFGWSLDAQYAESRPTEDTPREGAVNVTQDNETIEAVAVRYRERSRTRSRSMNGQIARSLSRRVTLRARGSISLGTNRYDVTDNAYLAQTNGVAVKPGDPSDDYRQSYRIEATYAPNAFTSSTFGLEVARIELLQLNADRSIVNKEDRVYRSDWVWTYRLLPGLTANQRNQVSATYTHNIYVPKNNRLALSYTALTTLNARLTTHLSADLNHNLIYSPNGGYARAATDGREYFSVSDATRDYSLYGRLNYTPLSALTLSFNPTYTANQRDDRSSGTAVPTSRRRQLGLSAGANLNSGIGKHARVTGSINRSFDSRRDVSYSGGVPGYLPRTAYDFWNGSLQFTWNL